MNNRTLTFQEVKQSVFLEYSKEQIWLAKYLSSDDIDPYHWDHYVSLWAKQEWDNVDDFWDKYDNENVDYETLDKDDQKKFRDWLEDNIDKLESSNPEDSQPNRAMDFIRYVKPTEWLIHFSDDAYDIAWRGFRYGSDIEMLHITTWKGERLRKDEFGTWAFAFLAGSRDARGGSKKYGKEAVLFRSNAAILVSHYGDNENQVIFDRSKVTDRIYMQNVSDGHEWAIMGKKKGNVVFQGSLDDALSWVTKNYAQYRKSIIDGNK